MALIAWKFVDQPIASPTTLFDMNNGTTTRVLDPGPEMPAPPLRRSIAQNAMTDGGILTSAAYDLRELKFTVWFNDPSLANRIALLDSLKRELAKPSNLLMFMPPGGSNPVFFRTIRSDEYLPDYQGAAAVNWKIQCSVLAEPFAIGIRRDLAQVTVVNDPANSSTALNSNTSFETNTTGWTGVGGTLARDTSQFHSGVASAKITPDGVTATVMISSANVAVTGGSTYRAQAWVRNAVARSVAVNINWYDASSTYITTGSGSVSVAANTWTFISTDMVAPSNAAFANIIPTLTGTPPATNVLNVDEVELRAVPSGNATYLDLTGIVGDSPTPAFVRIQGLGAAGTAVLAQRTVNNPTALTVVAQMETATLGTDTATWSSTAMSANNGIATNFATTASLVTRATVTVPTASSADALRGRYRVLLRVHAPAADSTFQVRFVQNSGGSSINGPTVSWVTPNASNWYLLDLGVLEFPAFQSPSGFGYSGLTPGFASSSLSIQVGKTTGGSPLDMDYVYLLPADERMCSVKSSAAAGYVVLDGPNDMTYGMASGTSPFSGTLSSRTVDNAGGLVPRIGGLPMLVPGTMNRWYMLLDGQTVTTTKTVDISYWPRWREVATS